MDQARQTAILTRTLALRPKGHEWFPQKQEIAHAGTPYERMNEELYCPRCCLYASGPYFEQASGALPIYMIRKSDMTPIEWARRALIPCNMTWIPTLENP